MAKIAGGQLTNSKPCQDCIKVMQRYKIHKVYYSVPGGFMVEKVSSISNERVSYGHRVLREGRYV